MESSDQRPDQADGRCPGRDQDNAHQGQKHQGAVAEMSLFQLSILNLFQFSKIRKIRDLLS